MFKKFAVSFFFLFNLSGCDSSFLNDAHASVRQNSYPFIVDSVAQMVPVFSEKNNPEILNQICGVIYGVKQQKDLDRWLEKNIPDYENISSKTSLSDVLSGKDKSAQRTLCASWLSSSINFIPNVDDFTNKDNDGKITGFNDKAIAELMPIRIAVARANAEVFATIADVVAKKKPLSVFDTKKLITELFDKNSQQYLDKVIEFTAQEKSRLFELVVLQKGRFIFKDSGGFLFDVSSDGVNLSWYGVPWLSKGKLKGYEYFF